MIFFFAFFFVEEQPFSKLVFTEHPGFFLESALSVVVVVVVVTVFRSAVFQRSSSSSASASGICIVCYRRANSLPLSCEKAPGMFGGGGRDV